MIRETLLAATLLSSVATATSIGTTHTVGWEDWSGPTSDRDFNDTVFNVTGVNFHTTDTWTKPVPAQWPNETPFPFDTASYFDSATAAGGDIVATFPFQQTSATEAVFIRIGTSGEWQPITGSQTFSAVAGDTVSFLLDLPYGHLYPTGNEDGMPHAIEAVWGTPAEAPEPAGVWLGLGGLAAVFAGRLRRRK